MLVICIEIFIFNKFLGQQYLQFEKFPIIPQLTKRQLFL